MLVAVTVLAVPAMAAGGAPPTADATGIYRSANGVVGACTRGGAANPAGVPGLYPAVDEIPAGTGPGPTGTWAWLFSVSGAGPAGATLPPAGLTLGGPLAGQRDSAADAGASLDEAIVSLQPGTDSEHTGRLSGPIVAFARAYPGPWHLTVAPPAGPRPPLGTAQTGSVTVVAANGAVVPVTGLPQTVTATGATVTLGPVRDGRAVLTVVPSAPSFSYTVASKELAPAGAPLYRPTVAGYQTLEGGAQAAGSVPITGQATPLRPTVRTTATATSATVGARLSDEIVVTGTGGAAVPVSVVWLGPVTPTAVGCASVSWIGAARFARETVTVDGSGTVSSPATPAVSRPGCYTAFDALGATPTTAAVAVPPGAAPETVLVKTVPRVTTVARPAHGTVGARLTDTVSVSAVPGAVIPITVRWLGPLIPPAPSTSCAGLGWAHAPDFATLHLTVSVGRDGVGQDTSPPSSVVRRTGCYTAVESAGATPTSVATTSPPGAQSETMLIGAGLRLVQSDLGRWAPPAPGSTIAPSGSDPVGVGVVVTLSGAGLVFAGVAVGGLVRRRRRGLR